MKNVANISFFESLGSASGTCVPCALPVENAWYDVLKKVLPTAVTDRWNQWRLSPNTDPKTTLVANIVLRPVKEMRATVESIQKDLTNTVFGQAPDCQALLTRCRNYTTQLNQLVKEYKKAVALAERAVLHP